MTSRFRRSSRDFGWGPFLSWINKFIDKVSTNFWRSRIWTSFNRVWEFPPNPPNTTSLFLHKTVVWRNLGLGLVPVTSNSAQVLVSEGWEQQERFRYQYHKHKFDCIFGAISGLVGVQDPWFVLQKSKNKFRKKMNTNDHFVLPKARWMAVPGNRDAS